MTLSFLLKNQQMLTKKALNMRNWWIGWSRISSHGFAVVQGFRIIRISSHKGDYAVIITRIAGTAIIVTIFRRVQRVAAG